MNPYSLSFHSVESEQIPTFDRTSVIYYENTPNDLSDSSWLARNKQRAAIRAELARFIQVVKVDDADTRFHLGELEAFENGVVQTISAAPHTVSLTTSKD